MDLRENMLRIIQYDNPERITNKGFFTVWSRFVERPEHRGYDDWGVYWEEQAEAEGGTYPSSEYLCQDIDKALQMDFPNPNRLGLFEPVKEFMSQHDSSSGLVFGNADFGLFERSWLLLGMENLLVYTITEPDKVFSLMGRIADFKIAIANNLLDCGVDGVQFGDDWGAQNALFLRPEIWRKLIKPHQARMYKTVKERGGFVWQHSCGHIEEIIPDLIEIGLDIWDPCQPRSNNLRELKKICYGKLTMKGGIDSQGVLTFGTPEEVREKVKELMFELGRGGGYIPSPSHGVPYRPEILKAMEDAIEEFGHKAVKGDL